MRCCSRNLLTTLIFEYLGACVMALFCPEMLNFLRGPTFVCSLATLILKRATSCLISLQEKGLFLKIFTFLILCFLFVYLLHIRNHFYLIHLLLKIHFPVRNKLFYGHLLILPQTQLHPMYLHCVEIPLVLLCHPFGLEISYIQLSRNLPLYIIFLTSYLIPICPLLI